MIWVEVFAVLLVSHLVGDFLLQTDWQAAHKHGGLGTDPVRRRALLSHVTTYMLAFVPALIWIASEAGIGRAILAVLIVGIPHWIQDDGRLLDLYMAVVKGLSTDSPGLRVAVDQSFHAVMLFLAALILAS
ncbi:MAG TPA: DUF3307 domain-containing protein [Solirubrobacterales bacterium]|nr:DUF3307 domain-containing protein [Solirubrobacterales bacterium]